MVNHQQQTALVVAAIKTLPNQCRDVALLHTQNGLSYREIAGRLGLSEATVRVQMVIAVRKCAEFVRNLERTAEEKRT